MHSDEQPIKLLSVCVGHHDANMAFCDGREVKYIKLERVKQEKRFGFQSLLEWQREVQHIWGLDVTAFDDVVLTFDPGALPASLKRHLAPDALYRLAFDKSKAERLAPDLCDYLGIRSAWLISHHYSHALSTWMQEPRTPDVQIVVDGLGDGRPWSVYRQDKLVAKGHIGNGSIGWGIRDAGKLLGIKYGHYNDIAGKVMGLQSYGTVDQGYLHHLRQFDFNQIKEVWSNSHWLAYKTDSLLGQLGGLDWVATVHERMGEMLLDFFKRFAGPSDLIAYSGGVAQNVHWNARLKAYFPNLMIAPHACDEGLSLGSLEWLRRQHGLAELVLPNFPYSQSDASVAAPSVETIQSAAQWLAQGKIVGWYQGGGEVGPRALGNRSILMDPRLPHGKELMNAIKKRENYRPFGASVLQEHFQDHFSGAQDEFMLLTCAVNSIEFPAITHVDGTCRVQSVGQRCAVFRQLLTQFHAITGCPVLLNTSLNLAGKPIAAFPEAAKQLFFDSPIDVVIIGDEVHCRGTC
jgi:carbamoyltransferase